MSEQILQDSRKRNELDPYGRVDARLRNALKKSCSFMFSISFIIIEIQQMDYVRRFCSAHYSWA